MMLKKRPNERISADEALEHVYFKDVEPDFDDPVVEPINNPYKGPKMSVSTNGSESPVLDSPLLTTANQKRKLDKNIKKDSCVDFHMAK